MEPRRRFRFLKELASGGFGKVYLAEMITGDGFSSAVAIKVLHARWANNHEIVSRSRDEARLLGRLRHANIVRVEDLTAINGQCAIVMEYLNGVDLRSICTWLSERGRAFPRQALFEVVAGVASALDAAYTSSPPQGGAPLRVIHRDIKPSNVMITVEGDVKVLDFGTARATFAEREAQTEALAFGSTAFMSPERHMGDEDTPAADVFSLGVTTFELLTCQGFGKIQVRRERFEEVLAERLGEIELAAVPEAVRGDVVDLLRGMLAYDVEARPTAAQVVERMEHLAEATRDGGVKRFAREVVRPLAAQQNPEPDTTDTLAGNVVFEDSGTRTDPGFATRPASTTTWNNEGDPVPANITTPIPDLEEPAFGLPPPPTVAPPPLAAVLTPDPFAEPPPRSSTGLIVKIAAGLTGLSILAALTAGALWYLVVQQAPATPMTPVPVASADTPRRTNLPAGSAEADWAPNRAGAGGALLHAARGAADVTVTSTGGYRGDWNGTGWFRIRDAAPGVYRTKAVPDGGGPAVRGDFRVEADRTCVFELAPDGTWERGECR